MDKQLILELNKRFEGSANEQDGVEYWMGIPQNRPLADFLPTITIKAKDFATEITNFNTKEKKLNGEAQITQEHIKNNRDVRALLGKSGIAPEALPPEEDVKKLERRLKPRTSRL